MTKKKPELIDHVELEIELSVHIKRDHAGNVLRALADQINRLANAYKKMPVGVANCSAIVLNGAEVGEAMFKLEQMP